MTEDPKQTKTPSTVKLGTLLLPDKNVTHKSHDVKKSWTQMSDVKGRNTNI